MKVGILTDEKYDDRAFENINKVFPSKWIRLEGLLNGFATHAID